jgi:transposase
MTLSTGCLVYKNRQLQNQIGALENELRWTLSARLDALPSASEEVKEEQKKKKGKAPKVECASSVEPSVSRV